jgi:hypothetical protein
MLEVRPFGTFEVRSDGTPVARAALTRELQASRSRNRIPPARTTAAA